MLRFGRRLRRLCSTLAGLARLTLGASRSVWLARSAHKVVRLTGLARLSWRMRAVLADLPRLSRRMRAVLANLPRLSAALRGPR